MARTFRVLFHANLFALSLAVAAGAQVAPVAIPAPPGEMLAAQARPVPSRGVAAARVDDRLRGFSVTLVQGDTQGASSVEGLPAAAAKAVADMKDFLPYKRYTLLDTQWTIGAGRMRSQLRGPDGKSYELDLVAGNAFSDPAPPPQTPHVFISEFHLREIGATAGTTGASAPDDAVSAQALESQLKALEATRADLKGKGVTSANADAAAEEQLEALRSKLNVAKEALARQAKDQAVAGDSIIDTAFRMNIGETVVVGTSRLQGDKALIVLLTAVGK